MKNEKLITVTFIKSHARYAYFGGNVGKIRETDLEELQDGGFVKLYPGDDGEGNENPFPEDFPARVVLFDNGYKSIEQVKEAGETLTEIKGIGKATVKDIANYEA